MWVPNAMRFLFRVAFWLTVVVLLLPSDPGADPNAPQVSFVEALNAVRDTFNDLANFCTRNPLSCETGGAVVEIVADKARYGLEQLQGYLETTIAEENTLTAADTEIPWQGAASPGEQLAEAY